MNKRYLFIFFWMLAALPAVAQYTSLYGRFQVDEKSGCAPFTINLTINAPDVCDGANPCDMDWNGDNTFPDNLVFTHTYTQPGTYWLQVLFQTTGLDSILVEVRPDIPPGFNLYTCGGNQVQYEITDTNYDEYVVNFNDGSPPAVVNAATPTGQHTFAIAGAQNISVRGRNADAVDNCTAATQSFNALPVIPPPVIDELAVTAADEIRLSFTSLPNVQYQLEVAVNGGAFSPLQDVYNNAIAIAGGLDTDNNYYCFRLGAFDPCNNTTAWSETICSIDLNLSVLSDQHLLDWRTDPTNAASLDLLRNNALYQSLPGTADDYTDIDVVCNTAYAYQVVANYSNGSRSLSAVRDAVAFSDRVPTVVENISAIVSEGSVELVWTQDPAFTASSYTLSKSNAGSAFAALGSSSDPFYTDGTYLPDDESCYQVQYTDVCGNESPPSPVACPIRLSGKLNDDNSVTLDWTSYSGWTNGVQLYRVEKYTTDGVLLDSYDAGTSQTYTDTAFDPDYQEVIYVVVAVAADAGLAASNSQPVPIIKEPRLIHPKAFTPNNDGLNDRFVVMGQFITSYRITIFNRWGELIWSSSDLADQWDGTLNGKVLPEGTYAFHAEVVDLAGRTFSRSGGVLLLRK